MNEQFIHINVEGTKSYYKNRSLKTLHRVDGPAVERADGSKYWWVAGKCHRVDGPAIERINGDKFWYLNGKLHRVDGPAFERATGTKYWYLNGVKFSQAKFNKKIKSNKINVTKASCEGKTVVVDGVTYKLKKV